MDSFIYLVAHNINLNANGHALAPLLIASGLQEQESEHGDSTTSHLTLAGQYQCNGPNGPTPLDLAVRFSFAAPLPSLEVG
jgi:hypothetical protein